MEEGKRREDGDFLKIRNKCSFSDTMCTNLNIIFSQVFYKSLKTNNY